MMNAGNLNGKARQMKDWRRRLVALVAALSLLISSCGLTAFAESDDDIYSAPVTAPIAPSNASPEPEETAEATPAPEGQEETGTEPAEGTGEENGTEPGEETGTGAEGEHEVSEEPVDLTAYEPGTLTAEADDIAVTLDYTAEARIPEGTVFTLARAAGGDLYTAMKSAARVLKEEQNETWKREMGDEALFYLLTLTTPEGTEIHPTAGVTLTCTNLVIPADATGFVTGSNAENVDWTGDLNIEFLPDAIGYAYLKQVQIGTVTLVHEDRDYMVTASYGPDAGFPVGTQLKVREIMPGTPEYTLYSGMTDEALNEDWSEITLERYFDIAFVKGEAELEPQADVDVQITFRDKIEENEDTEVAAVHIENNEANVIESETDSQKAAKHDDEAIDTVAFTSDSFSVYGVVQKKKIITKILDAQGHTYEIEVTYTQEAEIPEDAQVKVEEIPEGSDLWEAYRLQTAAALNADDVRLPGLYDISIVDAEGNKVEPKAAVNVAFKLLNDDTTEDIQVVHFKEEIPQELVEAAAQTQGAAEQTEVQIEPLAEEDKIASEEIQASVEGDTVTFDTDSFSVYAFAYTIVTYYKVASGETYKITLNYDENSGIPAGSTLNVEEILPGDSRYNEYLEKALKAAKETTVAEEAPTEDATTDEETDTSEEAAVTDETTETTIPENQYARFFDIEIQSDGQKVEPTGKVSVTVELADAPEDRLDELKVVHFAEERPEIVENAVVTADSIQFSAESFSIYGIICAPTVPSSVNDLDGRSCLIRHNDQYLTSTINTSNTVKQFVKTTNKEEATIWYFEKVTVPNFTEYYSIYTYDSNNQKQYIALNRIGIDNSVAEAGMGSTGTWFRVIPVNGKYRLQARVGNGYTYYLNEWQSDGKAGFAAYGSTNDRDDLMNLDFPVIQNSEQYAVIVKVNDNYYAVRADGTLELAEYNPEKNIVTMNYPLFWTYDDSGNNGKYLRISTEGDFRTEEGPGGVASHFYYRYICVNEDSGISSEVAGYPDLRNWGTIVFDGNLIHGADSHNNQYIGIETNDKGEPIRIAGNKSRSDAKEVFLAKTQMQTANSLMASKHAVQHLDIAIRSDAQLEMQLPNGKYYDQNRVQILEVTKDNPVWIHVHADEFTITEDDIKNADIVATNNAGKELENAFYITGYSNNKNHGEGYPAQVRIEGMFKVAEVSAPLPSNYRLNVPENNQYQQLGSGFDTVRNERLNNQIKYTVSTTKIVTFTYRTDNNQVLCDASGKPITITIPVTLSGSCTYWDTNKNECPGNDERSAVFNANTNIWKDGYIIGDGGQASGGIDFRLGSEKANVVPKYPSVKIYKYVTDGDGQYLSPEEEITNSFRIYQIENDTNEKKSAIPSTDYSAYTYEQDVDIPVSGGIGMVKHELSVTSAMVYIEELKDENSLPRILTVNGERWQYVRTVIDTEKVRTSEDNSHTTGNLTLQDEHYNSRPEVVGSYINGSSPDPFQEELTFYVYNVYEPITSITVSKLWQNTDGTALSDSEIPSSATFKLKRFYNTESTGATTPASGGSGYATVKIVTCDGAHTYAEEPVPIGSSVRFILTITGWQGNNHRLTYKYGSTEGSFTLENTSEIKYYTSENIPVNGDVTIQLLKKGTIDINQYNISPGTAFSTAWPYLEVIEGSGSSISNGTTTTTRVEDTVFNNSNEHTLTLPISGSWTGSFTDLEKTGTALIDGTEKEVTYYYYIEEQSALGAQWSVTYENNTGIIGPGTITVTNKKEPPHETSVTVNKRWVNVEGTTVDWPKDGDGNYTPAYVTVQLQRRANSSDAFTDVNGAVQNIYPEEREGQHTTARFDNLDPAYEYTVAETAIDGVKSTIVTNADGSITVKNLKIPTVDIEAQKQWNNVPEEDQVNAVQFTLYQKIGNGQATAVEQSATLTNPQAILKDQDWSGKATWSNLPTYDVTGETPVAITYSVEETGIFTGDLEGGALPADPTWTPAATRYTVSGNGNVSFSEGGNSATVIITNTKITVPLLKVTKEWYNVLPEDLVYYPTVYFTLYQMKATDNNFNQAHIYRPGGEGDNSFVNIPLSYAKGWTWTCDQYLPETDDQGNPVKYFAAERTADGNVGTRTVYLDDPYWNVNDNVRVQTIEYKSRSTVGTGDDWDRRGEPNNPNDAWVGNSGEILIRNTALDYMQMDVKKKFLYYYPNQGGYGYSLGTGTSETEYLHDRVIVIQVMRRAVIDDGSNTEAFGWQAYGEPIAVGYGPGGVSDHIEINGINGIENPFTLIYSSAWEWYIHEHGGLIGFGFYTVNNQRVRVLYQYTLKELGAYSDRALTHPLNDFDWTAILPEVWDGTGKHVNVFGNLEAQDPDRLVNVQSTDLSISKTWSATNTDVEEVYVKVFRNSGVNYNSSKQDYTNVIGTRLDNSGVLQPVYDGEIASDNLVTIDGEKYIKVPADGTAITISKIPTLQYGQNPEKYYYWIEECGYKPINGDPVMNTDRYTVSYTVSNVDTLAGDSNRTGSAVIRLGGKGTNTFTILNTSSEGALNITKAVTTGSEADDEVFTFEAVLTPENGENIDTASLAVTGGTLSSAVKDDNTGVVTVTLTITGTGTAVITGIPAETTYVVTETDIPDNWKQSGDAEYSDPGKTVSAGETSDTVTITNTEVVNVTVKKTWSKTIWPDEKLAVQMTLKANGETATDTDLPTYNDEEQTAVVTLTSVNATTGHTWYNLPKYNQESTLIDYTVEETGVMYNGDLVANWNDIFTVTTPTTDSSSDAIVIDNTPVETTIQVTKVWTKNGKSITPTQTSIGFEVYQVVNGTATKLNSVMIAVGDATPTPNSSPTVQYVEGSGWQTVTVSGLPAYILTASGYVPASYYVVETDVSGDTKITYQKAGAESDTDTPSEAATSSGLITIYNRDTDLYLKVLKVDNTDKEKYLTGAEFQLLKKNTDNGNYLPYINSNFTDSLYMSSGEEKQTITDKDNGISFRMLTDGDYKLIETSAPAGYLIAQSPEIMFTVTNGVIDPDITEDGSFVVGYEKETDKDGPVITIGNTPGVELPSTGGSGTLIYTVTGIFLITLAGVLLVARKRKANR